MLHMAIPCSHALVVTVARCALAVPLFVPLGIAVYAPANGFAKHKQLFFDRLVDLREVPADVHSSHLDAERTFESVLSTKLLCLVA
jgi:hypothetical protein